MEKMDITEHGEIRGHGSCGEIPYVRYAKKRGAPP